MIDQGRVTEAILATGVAPLSLEDGAELVQYWIDNEICGEHKIIAVECGFLWWADERTAVIGVQDLLTEEVLAVARLSPGEREELGRSTGVVTQIIGNEWKTSRPPNKYYDENRWFEDIRDGHQIAIYALALRHGRYYEAGTGNVFEPAVAKPRIRVRAIVKTSPPMVWEGDNGGMVEFDDERLERTRRALLTKAASIRAMRATKLVPWQLPGIWCENKFKRVCEYLGECNDGRYPVGIGGLFDENDPAFGLVFDRIGKEKMADPELVVLGASAYGAVSECAEKYRRNTLGGGTEESLALMTGTAFHGGVAEYYRQLREQQLLVPATISLDNCETKS